MHFALKSSDELVYNEQRTCSKTSKASKATVMLSNQPNDSIHEDEEWEFVQREDPGTSESVGLTLKGYFDRQLKAAQVHSDVWWWLLTD